MNIKNKFLFSSFTFLLILLNVLNSFGQREVMNMEDHDQKPYYFGLSFGANSSALKIRATDKFTQSDSVKSLQAKWGPGFHIGLMGSLKLNSFVDLRFVPVVSFSEKGLEVTYSSNTKESNTLESIYMQLPLQLKFKSDRIRNFRFYSILGARFDYDLASNANSRKPDELIRIKPMDISGEVGFGLEFYYPNFIVAPEIKISQGLINSHLPDPSIYISNMVDRMNTRTVTLSLLIQG
ncbi:MAG TPA: porin family protein [Edaphocola sp.]|nr:porin family protein [Edaphocola sp.]